MSSPFACKDMETSNTLPKNLQVLRPITQENLILSVKGLLNPVLHATFAPQSRPARASATAARLDKTHYTLILNNISKLMDNANQPNNSNQLQIELSPEVAEGIYANLAIITHSSAEVVMDFIRVLPGVPKANVKSRIVLAPEHAKRLLLALQDNIAKYEKAFGTINLPGAPAPQGGRTATPFGVPEGKA